MDLSNIIFKKEYRTFTDNIPRDFYEPALNNACLYQRAVGFFSSSAILSIKNGIDGLINNNGKIQLIASPKLSEDDIKAINEGYERRKIIENALLREIREEDGEYSEMSMLTNLIAKGILDIKIAFLSNGNSISMYHEKMGIISDDKGNAIAFSGSMNESENAFSGNYEAFDVYCSWTNDADRVFDKKMAFKAIWEDFEPGVNTMDFPSAVKNKMIDTYVRHTTNKINKNKMEQPESKKAMYLPEDFTIRDYQEKAINSWKNHKYRGIYDMATGTGKTLTALASLEQLFRDNKSRLAIIIVCPYQHLVEQWVEDIVRFGINPIIGYSASRQKKWKKNLEQAVNSFLLEVSDFFCFITTNASFVTKAVQNSIEKLSDNTVIVIDEAHNMGAENNRRYLPDKIPYRLALSATIDRHNDFDGTLALREYFGEKCIEYSLKEAIESGMLTRYYYHPVISYLDADELDTYRTLSKDIARALIRKDGKIKLSERAKQLLIKRAQVVAGARSKLEILEREIKPFINDRHILVYCGAAKLKDEYSDGFIIRQIDAVADLLGNKLHMRVGRFTSQETAQERELIRNKFSQGDQMQALIAIRCLDEGVNIPSIKTAFILASSTNPKEYIQRRGRVLRKFPGKDHAEIYDFITLPYSLREAENLSTESISYSKSLIKKEILRMIDFSDICENPSEARDMIYKLKHVFNISEDELKESEDDNDVI